MTDQSGKAETASGLGADPAGGPPGGGQPPAETSSETAAAAEPSAAQQESPAESFGDGFAVPGGPEELTAEGEQAAGEVDPLSQAQKERDDYKDALIRLQADFENYKKRMLKQQTEHLERAAASLVDKLLPVLDTADLALAHGGGEDVKQITGGLISALEKEGLERIAGEGAPFDPTLHDAVAHEPSDADGEQTVVEVLRAGYRWKGRVLRPAMVKVRG